MCVQFASILDLANSHAYLNQSKHRSTSIYGLQNKIMCVLCVCVCGVCACARACVHVRARVCMCVRVKSQSQCGFNLQAYWIWLGIDCYLDQSTHSVHSSTDRSK